MVLLIRVAGTLIFNNYALLFESFHILTDLMVTFVVFAALKISSSHFSERYSYGLYRIEDLVSLTIALIIAFTAIDLLLSIESSRIPTDLDSGMIQFASVIPLFLSGIVKIIGGKRLKSPSLVSDGYHNYSDVYVGIGVGAGLVLVYATGIGAFYYGAIGIASIGIFYTAIVIGKNSIVGIMDLPKDKKVIPKIETIVREDAEVTGIKSIKARWAGPVIFVEIVLTVNSRLTIEEAHDVADTLESRVLNQISDVRDVVIHIEPSRNPERVIMVPLTSDDSISANFSRSSNYRFIHVVEGSVRSSETIEIPEEEIGREKNAQRVLNFARDNKVTDVIATSAGEILVSLLTLNHIRVWKAQSEAWKYNLELLLQNKLQKFWMS